MRVGALYAILRLEKSQFDAALTTSGGKFASFVGIIKAGAWFTAQAFAAVAAGSLFMAQNFEQHMNQALAIMGDVAPKLRQEMEDAARAVAKTTTFSAVDAADAYYFLASAGYTAQQSIKALPVVAQFAQAGMMDLETATSLLMDTQTTLGLRSKDATENMENMTRVSDVLTAAQVHSNATLQQMAEAMTNKAGPALRLLGKDIEEGAAVLAVMANQGVKGRVAGTNLAIVLRELQTKAIKNKDTFKELGVAVFDASGNMRNIADIIEDLEDATAGLSDEQEKQLLLDLGFTDRSVGFIQALIGRSQAIRDYEELLKDAGGTTQDVAEKQLETFNAQLKLMWHRIQDVAISIGQKLLPGATDIVKAINDWIDINEDLIVQLAVGIVDAIAAVIGKVKEFIGVVGTVVEDFGELFKGMATEDDFGGAWGWLVDNLPGVAEAVESIAFWIGAVVRNLGNLEDFVGVDSPLGHFADIVHGINEAFEYFIEEVFPELKEIFAETVGRWIDSWGDRIEWFTTEIWPKFVSIWNQFLEETLPKIQEAFGFIANVVIPWIGEKIQWFIDNPVQFLLDAFEMIVTWVDENWPLISETVTRVFTIVGLVFFGAVIMITNFVTGVWEILEPIARVLIPLIGTALVGLMVIFNFVWDTIETIVEGAGEAIGLAMDIIGAILAAASGDWETFADKVQDAINRILEWLGLVSQSEKVMRGPFPKSGSSGATGPGTVGPKGPSGVRPPGLAGGTMNFPGGFAIVGEEGPELAYMPSGSKVWPAGTGPGGDIHVVAVVEQNNVASFGTPAEIREAARVLAPAVVEVLRQRGLTSSRG